MKILCVDDDPEILDLLKRVLQSDGHEVLTSESGAGALQQALRAEFDLLIIDMMLPDLHGAEIIRATKAQAPALPAIGMSAAHEPAVEAEAVDAGVGRFLRKPFRIADLLGEVRLVESLRGRIRLLLAGRLAGEQMLARDLRQEGFVVLLAPTTDAVRATIRGRGADVILAETGGDPGAELVLAWKKAEPELRDIAVVAVTHGGDDEPILREGASLCLPAPVDARPLAALLHFMHPGGGPRMG